MSWKPEVIADSSDKWAGNSLRFATEQEAKDNVAALKARWWLVTDTRVIEVDEPVTARWVDGKLESLPISFTMTDNVIVKSPTFAERVKGGFAKDADGLIKDPPELAVKP
jgi:hypothetical protein